MCHRIPATLFLLLSAGRARQPAQRRVRGARSVAVHAAPAPALGDPFAPPSIAAVLHSKHTAPEFKLDKFHGFEDRAVGCLLAAMCGDILGSPIAGDKPYRIASAHPKARLLHRFAVLCLRGFLCTANLPVALESNSFSAAPCLLR